MVTLLKITVTQPVHYLSFNIKNVLRFSNIFVSWFKGIGVEYNGLYIVFHFTIIYCISMISVSSLIHLVNFYFCFGAWIYCVSTGESDRRESPETEAKVYVRLWCHCWWETTDSGGTTLILCLTSLPHSLEHISFILKGRVLYCG